MKIRSRIKYWSSLVILLSGLSLTLYFIIALKQGHGNKLLASMGFSTESQVLNWCSNRVKTLSFPKTEGQALFEEEGQWVWRGATTNAVKSPMSIPLNYLKVEKWLAQYCQLDIEKIQFSDFNSPLVPIIKAEFVDGGAVTFYDLGKGRIQVQDQIFKSPAFRKGLKELLDFAPGVR